MAKRKGREKNLKRRYDEYKKMKSEPKKAEQIGDTRSVK